MKAVLDPVGALSRLIDALLTRYGLSNDMLAIFGFCYLAWDEFRQRRGRPASERPQHAAVHGQHHAGDER